jgi:hypothetical protein
MNNCLRITIALMFLSNLSFGQISLRVFNYRPTGELGFTMKPLVSAEIGWKNRFSESRHERFRYGFSIMYLNFKPRMEVFPTYGVLRDGGVTTVIPGAQSFQRYSLFQGTAGIDYAIIHKKKLNVFVGSDLLGGTLSLDYTSNSALINETYKGGGILLGLRFRLGLEYSLTNAVSAFFTTNHSRMIINEPRSFFRSNDLGLGARYSFN